MRMLYCPFSVARQLFESIPRRYAKILERLRRVEHCQFPQCNPLNI